MYVICTYVSNGVISIYVHTLLINRGVTNHWTTNHWTGLDWDWTGILKFVFTHCGMHFAMNNYP